MRTTFLLLGHISIAIGFVGIIVPLLPTTPFVLLAAVCYSRGSDRFHTWLHEHPKFGPMIHSWREHGAIGIRAKVAAVITVVASIAYSAITLRTPWSVVALLAGLTVLTFILTRPSTGAILEGSVSKPQVEGMVRHGLHLYCEAPRKRPGPDRGVIESPAKARSE